MDDGFQNPSLAKDFSVLVVDARRGVGNGKVIPAGPLRAPLGAQLARAHALVVIGDGVGAADVAADARARSCRSSTPGSSRTPAFVAALGGGRVLAFAGIGDPDKFFATLRDAGIAVGRDPQLSGPSPLHAGRGAGAAARRPTARASSW